MGLFATNDPALVDDIIKAIGATGDEEVPGADGRPKAFRQALISDYIITQPSKEFLKALIERAGDAVGDLRGFVQRSRAKEGARGLPVGIRIHRFPR